jgi:ABC-type amino acid transport substrate-binding protein
VRRLSVVFLALAWISLLLGACSGKSTATPTPGNGDAAPPSAETPINGDAALPLTKVRIGVDATFPPFESFDRNKKESTGFDVELMRAIAAREGLDVEFANVEKNRLLTGVLNCEYDAGISAISMTDELKQQIVFSEPYLSVGQVVVVKKGNITITGRDLLSGMTVAVQLGSPVVAEMQSIPDVQLLAYPSIDAAFTDLIAGYIDAVVAGKPRAQSYVNIPANNLKIVGEEFGGEDYGIAVCNTNAELAAKINAGLGAVKADGTLDKLAQQWLQSVVTQ